MQKQCNSYLIIIYVYTTIYDYWPIAFHCYMYMNRSYRPLTLFIYNYFIIIHLPLQYNFIYSLLVLLHMFLNHTYLIINYYG